jgi:type II secretory pathway pseudopilin PulG
MSRRSHTPSSDQAGFTLAGVLVILTILAVVLAYTVPSSWSDIMRREREHQTIFVMKQYARAIQEFQRTRNALPTSLDQLEEQKQPRVIRRMYENPLSGEMDWILVAPGAPQFQPGAQIGAPGITTPIGGGTPGEGQPGTGNQPAAGSPADYRGPFVGVRPPQTGPSMVVFREQDQYENWSYTILDLQQEQAGPQQQPPQGGVGAGPGAPGSGGRQP